LLRRYKALGITIVPALGYQMISEEFPRSDELLCETRTQGAPWGIYSKLTFFDPAAITETNYGAGRHGASPTGRVIAPAHDELLLLHYKFLGFERTHLRHQQLHSGLRSKDIENGWGYQYGWSEEEFRHTWREFAGNAIDVRTDAAIANCPGPPWWDPFRAPRDISGNPIIEAALTDDFIRGVSTHTAKDKVEIARLQKRLSLWKLIAAGASVVAALLLSRAVLS
jgi:hypothetical protein